MFQPISWQAQVEVNASDALRHQFFIGADLDRIIVSLDDVTHSSQMGNFDRTDCSSVRDSQHSFMAKGCHCLKNILRLNQYYGAVIVVPPGLAEAMFTACRISTVRMMVRSNESPLCDINKILIATPSRVPRD